MIHLFAKLGRGRKGKLELRILPSLDLYRTRAHTHTLSPPPPPLPCIRVFFEKVMDDPAAAAAEGEGQKLLTFPQFPSFNVWRFGRWTALKSSVESSKSRIDSLERMRWRKGLRGKVKCAKKTIPPISPPIPPLFTILLIPPLILFPPPPSSNETTNENTGGGTLAGLQGSHLSQASSWLNHQMTFLHNP